MDHGRHAAAISEAAAQARAMTVVRHSSSCIERSAFMLNVIRCPAQVASRGRAHDLDLYLGGVTKYPPWLKARRVGAAAGSSKFERWLGEYDLLFLLGNHTPWRTWARLAEQIGRRTMSPTSQLRRNSDKCETAASAATTNNERLQT